MINWRMSPSPTCINCNSSPTIFISVVKAGQVITQGYCSEHAKALGVLNPQAYYFLQELEPSDDTLPPEVLRCSHCGFSQFDLNHQGRLGCAECYTVFEKQITPILKQIQVSGHHVGKNPYSLKNRIVSENRLHALQEDL
jgi:protein arginine kinase activator